MPVSEQVVVIYAVTEGYMDDVAVDDIQTYEDDLLEFFRTRYSGLLAGIADTGAMDEDAVVAAINEFKASRADLEGEG
jgi:F-type H+-transporting ATPase subunit alpha